jgi:dihydrodipicolinate synthase/N-acetylneuraminate lyase
VQVNLPGWVALTDDEVLSFYSVIAEEFPDVGIVVYDNAKSGRNVGAKLWPHLLRTVPSVIGGKMPYETREVLEAVRAVRPDFKFFAVETTLEAMAPHGVNGVTAWVSYSFPRIIGDLWQAVADGEWATFNRCLEQTKVLHEIKEIVRPKGYRASSMDRLMGLASGFLEPVFARVLSPWSSVAREDIGWVRAQVAARLGEEFLYSQ